MGRLGNGETGKWGDNEKKPSIMRYIGKKSVANLFPSPSLHVPYSQLPYSVLQITNYPTPNYQLPITNYPLPITNYRLRFINSSTKLV
jgi:hypothetical protein